MRLSIRRKLIGTLMLVGILPLGLSLIVILGGGATMRLHSIRNSYEHKAADSANQTAAMVVGELEKLVFLSRLPQVVNYAQDRTNLNQQRRGVGPVPAVTQPDAHSHKLDAEWKGLAKTADPLRGILSNPLSDRLRMLSDLDNRNRQLLATDAYGELIAADAKSDDYFQADEEWWQQAFAGGRGRIVVSSVVTNAVTGTAVVELVVPIYDESDSHRLIGVIKDKLDVGFLQQQFRDVRQQLDASAILYDTDAGRSVFALDDAGAVGLTEEAYRREGGRQKGLLDAVFGDLIIGVSPVPLESQLCARFPNSQLPYWMVVVSRPAQQAMWPVYRLAGIVAAVGLALILVLFVLGVAIANREIIHPIIRLREATAAVGRGELNVRLMSGDDPHARGAEADPTFRNDELGELAWDFDEMTRQLQKNVGQLAKANEAKRRFMELAGHELRTPVTYILGVCQLAQRQLQAHSEEAPGAGGPVTTAAKSTSSLIPALGKISSKAQRLSRIIENLLKLVSNDQFTTRLVKQPVDIRALVLHVCNDSRPFVNERHQHLVCDVAENLPTIEADHDKLEDALTNLMSNAIRFSPDNSTVRVAAHVTVGDMIEILVEDSGPGIPAADLANLFEPFFTGTDTMHHHSGTIEYGSRGIGLGLAIVRRFVEIHGGVVRANATGHGTQFQILLPINPTSAIGSPAGPVR